MQKYLMATAAIAAVATATPATARDGSGYIGLEVGALFPQDNDADVFAEQEHARIALHRLRERFANPFRERDRARLARTLQPGRFRCEPG